jgi:hypothetical protein
MATKTIDQLPSSSPLTGTEVLPIVQGNQTLKTTVQDIANLAGGGGGLSGTNFIYVAADGTDTANATALSAAYTTAKTMSPSATNRITIIAAPGKFNFGSSAFVMDTQYIDLVSLDGNRSIIFNSANAGGTISITANDVFVKGVDVLTKNFTIISNLNLLKVENCVGGDYSFGSDPTFQSLGEIVSGTFINCQGGLYSFGSNGGQLSGTFTNCVGGNNSFGGNGGTTSGTFTNCAAGNGSFGYTASGTFTNCIGAGGSFGYTASGTFTNCVGGDISFGLGGGTASGTFINCVAGNNSYGGTGMMFPGTLSGKLYYCILTSGTFITVSDGGRTYYCVDGNGNPNNQ